MYKKNIKRMRSNKKAIAMSLTSVIVILVALGVVAYITVNGIKGGFLMIKEISSKYDPPKINDTTVFFYSINDINVVDATGLGCSSRSDVVEGYTCPPNKYIDFSVNLLNSGSSMRKINGAIVVCKLECTRRGCTPKDCKNDITVRGTSACYLTANEEKECDAGSYQFPIGQYIVYSAAVCALESDIGCYSPAMREADKIFNPKHFVYITAQ